MSGNHIGSVSIANWRRREEKRVDGIPDNPSVRFAVNPIRLTI
jgi:hypothetical protein